ncbi:MAG: DUF2382 domain-containing protein [Nakamurella sp.]
MSGRPSGPVASAVDPDRAGDDVPAIEVLSEPEVLIRSEERLGVSTVRVPSRRVRLEKYVVTETRTITVQVSREEVRLVEVEWADPTATRDALDPADARRWLTVSEEQVVVTTTVVPVERVRLDVTEVTEGRTLTGELRRERVAFTPDSFLPGVPTITDPYPTTTTEGRE